MTNLELLREIQNGAVSSGTPVGDLLRRCQMLAARLGLTEMVSWVTHELDGYPPKANTVQLAEEVLDLLSTPPPRCRWHEVPRSFPPACG